MERNFQLIVTGVFIFFALVGVIVFATYGGGDSRREPPPPTVIVWGTIAPDIMQAVLRADRNEEFFKNLVYKYFAPDSFNLDFIEALAKGERPDLVIMPSHSLLRHSDKIQLLSYEWYPERAFKDTFVETGEILLSDTGIRGLPFTIDPMVMYWNRDMFTNVGLLNPPSNWDELIGLNRLFTLTDHSGINISQSLVALGEFGNITNAKGIISALIMQTGNPIIQTTGQKPNVVLSKSMDLPVHPTHTAVNFYADFSDPAKHVRYSWNRAMPEAKANFLAGRSALYFGYASEIEDIRLKNPNLNFDVARFPQIQDTRARLTHAKMHVITLYRQPNDTPSAVRVLYALTSDRSIKMLSEKMNLPPVRRDLLSQPQERAAMSTFYDSAIISRSWLEPGGDRTDMVFKEMIESVLSGRLRVSESVERATTELKTLVEG
jgi:ABC-type glycerol-3-phosphate transport system substrate-binding protein